MCIIKNTIPNVASTVAHAAESKGGKIQKYTNSMIGLCVNWRTKLPKYFPIHSWKFAYRLMLGEIGGKSHLL